MPRTVHFLHIGKTGGTAIKDALAPIADQSDLKLHKHTTRLWDVPESDGAFFFLRDPVTRFVSAFNSRLRMGRPRLSVKWNEAEVRAFAVFNDPNTLAEALSAADTALKQQACDAMEGIRHVNTRFSDWLRSPGYVEQRRASIVHVGHQESLAADFAAICAKLGLPQVPLPGDAHATPEGFQTHLSETGQRNIAAWYVEDQNWIDYFCGS